MAVRAPSSALVGAPTELDDATRSRAEAYRSPILATGLMNSALDREADFRARLQQHWEASERGDVDAEHAIYAAEAVLDYPRSGERFTGRSRIQAQRGGHPAERHFTIRRILGGGDLWVNECVITYDGVPMVRTAMGGTGLEPVTSCL